VPDKRGYCTSEILAKKQMSGYATNQAQPYAAWSVLPQMGIPDSVLYLVLKARNG
jgi:hypothetical protein